MKFSCIISCIVFILMHLLITLLSLWVCYSLTVSQMFMTSFSYLSVSHPPSAYVEIFVSSKFLLFSTQVSYFVERHPCVKKYQYMILFIRPKFVVETPKSIREIYIKRCGMSPHML